MESKTLKGWELVKELLCGFFFLSLCATFLLLMVAFGTY